MKGRIRLVSGIVVSAVLAILGVLFILSCYGIYKSGASPFTREKIGAAFDRIAPFVWVGISLVIANAVIHILLPADEPRLKGLRTPSVMVKTLAAKVDITLLGSEQREKIEKQRRLRSLLCRCRAVLLSLSAILPLFYLLNPANFPAVSGEYNAEILHGMLVYLAFLAPAAIYEVVFVIVRDLSLTREHEALKDAIKTSGKADVQDEKCDCPIRGALDFVKKNDKPILLGVRIALVGCALVFIALGVVNGGMTDVLNKAIKICTECIGLG